MALVLYLATTPSTQSTYSQVALNSRKPPRALQREMGHFPEVKGTTRISNKRSIGFSRVVASAPDGEKNTPLCQPEWFPI
jgi:hypothetical protein